jgi:hypothetical protein
MSEPHNIMSTSEQLYYYQFRGATALDQENILMSKTNSDKNEHLMRDIAVDSLSLDYIYPSQPSCGKLEGGSGGGGREEATYLSRELRENKYDDKNR